MENLDVARVFEDVADLLEIQDANPFRVRAYRAAARTIETLATPVVALIERDKRSLEKLPGIGKDLAGKICEIVQTGTLELLKELTTSLPESLVEMMRIPGVGPKRAKQVYDQLGVKTLAELEATARSGRLRTLHGWKETMETRVLQGIAARKAWGNRVLLADAEAYLTPLVAYLRETPGIDAIEVAGSFRRRRETVGDIDILATAQHATPVIDRFVTYPEVKQVVAKGGTKSSIVLRRGLHVDLRVVPTGSYGAALYYFTGSKAHNIAVRKMAVKRRLKVNEYGVFRGSRRIGGRTEADVFKTLGLRWIPPELREDRGEIAAALEGRLPKLVELSDIKGDLQMHTTYTDGRDTVAAMAQACADRGYAYLAITDHTQAVRVAGGLDRSGFRRQFREIARVQTIRGLTILKSAEVDILDDGRLDLDEATLAELDLVVASVHSRFNMTRVEMTRRIVRALQHPRVTVLGHPTGRLINRREPYAIDLGEVIKVARDHHVLLEINAQPDRLDLDDVQCQRAREAGVKLVISTDAHRVAELDCMRFGIDQARRGWAEAADIANTRTLAELRKLIEK